MLLFGLSLLFCGAIGYPYICQITSKSLDFKYTLMFNLSGFFMVSYFILHYSRFDLIFRKTGLGIDGAYPIKIKKVKNIDHFKYTFTLPVGLCTNDIKNKKSHIEEYLDKDIEIIYDSNRTFNILVYPR